MNKPGKSISLTPNVYYENIHNMVDLSKITGFDWDEGNTQI